MSDQSFQQQQQPNHQTLRWFQQQSELGLLELRPSFQRRPVWNEEQKSFLLDSILRGYPVPEVYLYTLHDQGNDDKVGVVDGQQRLRACLEFMADGFAINFNVQKLGTVHTLDDTPWFNKRYSELSEGERRRIVRYRLITRELDGLTEEQVKHVFFRVNQANVVLNSQELRFSMYRSGLLKTVEDLTRRDEWNHFRLFTTSQKRRMLDSEFIGELVVGYLHWPQNKKDDLDHYYRQYAEVLPSEHRVIERFEWTLGLLQRLFPEPRMAGSRWRNKSDFYTLFLAIARGRIAVEEAEIADVRQRLLRFSQRVSESEPLVEDDPIAVYRSSVARAASDRARRVRREDALVAFLAGEESLDIDDASDLEPEELSDVDPEDLAEYADEEEEVPAF